MRLKQILKLAATLCLGVIIIFSLKRPFQDSCKKRIQYFSPKGGYDYLFYLQSPRAKIDKVAIKSYEYYFRIVSHLQNLPEAWGMLGFCQYHLGKTANAIVSFKKAIMLDPDFFWYEYNLGLIYYKKGDYQKAEEAFVAALKTNPKTTLQTIYDSKMYIQLMVVRKYKTEMSLGGRLQQGYKNTLAMIVISREKIQEKQGKDLPLMLL